MSQQNRPQQPNQPQPPNQYPQQGNQQGYPPQYPSQQNYSPPPPPTNYQQAPPTPQMVEVVHRQKSNPVLKVVYILFWPFAKIFEFIAYIIRIILEEMLRGVIRFIFGLIFLALFFVMLGAFFVYIVAFFQVGFDFSAAFPRTIEIITGLLPF